MATIIHGSNALFTAITDAVASKHAEIMDYANVEISAALMSSAIDFQPGSVSFGPISITRTLTEKYAKESVDTLFKMLWDSYNPSFPGIRRPDSEWSDE